MPSAEIERFLARLNGVKADGSGWSARCPCRDDDHNPSLHVGEGKDGRVLVTCHRGDPCNLGQICTALGITTNDLFPKQPDPTPRDRKPGLRFVTAYDYTDTDGILLFQKVRYIDEATGTKTFRQRRRNPTKPSEWTWTLGDTPKVLYRLPDIAHVRANGGYIWVVEGERDADTLRALGETATTMPGGAGKWLPEHTATLAGLNVTVCADTDPVGLTHAHTVVRALRAAGCTVTAVQPPPPHKDITDFVDAGGALYDLIDLAPAPTEPASSPPTPTTAPTDHTGTPDTPHNPSSPPDTPQLAPFDEALAGLTALGANTQLSDAQKFTRAHSLLDSLAATTPLDPGRLSSWDAFFAETDQAYDWVIPGLLEAQDRVIVVASEGLGKSTLGRQIAIAAAVGLHPFTRQPIPKIRTLTIDLENPDRIIRRVTRNTYRVARAMVRHPDPHDAHLLVKPSGLNLLAAPDRAYVENVIEQLRPHLIVLGPLYKSFTDPGGRTAEAVVIEVVRYLDHLRDLYGCALWLEHHAPLGNSLSGRDLRPMGSAVWSRWPEFGLTLSRDDTATDRYIYDVGMFRGARDARHWPLKMRRGSEDDLPFHVLEYTTDP